MTGLAPDRIYVPLDTPDLEKALDISSRLKGLIGGVKVGKEFFTALGPAGVADISALGMPLFTDLKFHDIPNTVAGAVRSAMRMKPAILNVHAAGGQAMMAAARDAAAEEADKLGCARPLVLAVTVLTSLDDQDLNGIGVPGGTLEQVRRLARLTQESGLDGVVCSAAEIAALRKECGPEFKLLTPGIRPTWSVTGDQKRIVTPSDAVKRGADFLVIGRPITGADDPAEAARLIAEEIENGG
ncbi:MAG: orotidine-5'-phosphate decarboxylase [Rhodospirillales bacterium]|nr:orotidine-5'-phosphate decarboxylase [Rhodospirillales bacterium]